jgi:hypothetical protein
MTSSNILRPPRLGAPLVAAVGLLAVACQPSKPQPLYPAPRYLSLLGERMGKRCQVRIETSALPQHAAIDALQSELLALREQDRGGAGCTWSLRFSPTPLALSPDAATQWTLAGDNPERYALLTQHRDGDTSQLETQLYAESERGALYALMTALALPQPSVIVDWPAIPLRGLIEGYYGRPLTSSERLTTLKRMGWLRQNLFLYGPKDDPYARAQWATPYPPEPARELAEAAAESERRRIDFLWSISPGYAGTKQAPITPIQYSSDADFARLTAKIEQVRGLGVRKFSLFLDDISPELHHAADRAKFPSQAAAHAALMNRLQEYLLQKDLGARLLVVGTAYASDIKGWPQYNQELGPLLRPDIDVLWTGPLTFSLTIKASDMTTINGLLRRRVVIWDNWPLQPVALQGRSGDLADSVGGFLTNLMLSQDNKFPPSSTWLIMGTFADYGWDPSRYDPTGSLATWKAWSPRFP